jgi:hypothetical protein
MAAFLDGCRFNPAAGGTTDWTYSSVVPGYQSPAAAGAVNGILYKYRAESADLSQWEMGEGAYNSGTGTFARTTVLFNSAGTTVKINFTTVPQVAVVALAEDLPGLALANTFTNTTEATGTGTTAAAIISGGLEVLKKLFVTGLATFKSALSVTDATASTSTTTGAMLVTGGLGVQGRGNFGGNVAAPTLVPNAAVTTAWGMDFSNVTVTLAASTNSGALPNGSGLIFLTDGSVTGATALYLLGGSTQPVLVGQSGSGSRFIAGSTTPGANQYSVGFDGTNYRIYNGSGGSITFTVGMLKTRTTV